MGIHGLFKEIAPSIDRQSLAKLAADHYIQHSRPLVLAIDISIWLFQIQAGRGGSNPALRTFYYRLLRLLTLNIHPLFVFDGPNKPLWKRNKRVGGSGGGPGGAGHVRVATVPEFLAKQLLKHFAFPMHIAPGEAEAECALLQREGIVDAVLSEDVDTLMFGSRVLLRNWSAEMPPNITALESGATIAAHKKKSTSSKTPTHISVYRADAIKQRAGLDKEGMVLVALMSGGDYIVEGIPGCGPKTACDAARAGFGKELCALAARKDQAGITVWRDNLRHQFRTNEDKLLSKKRPSLASAIPDDFPNMEILGYYTHPCVSNATALTKLREGLTWDQPIDFVALRSFAGDAFDWHCLGGAKKFVRNLAPAMLIRELRLRGEAGGIDLEPDEREVAEKTFTNAIVGKRSHSSADGAVEYRVSYIPLKLVPIDLSVEDEDDQFTAAGEIDGMENGVAPLPSSTSDSDEDASLPTTKKTRTLKPYHPEQPDKLWILQTFVQLGCPLMLEDYEAKLRNPGRALKTKNPARAGTSNGKSARAKTTTKRINGRKVTGVETNAIMKYATITKSGTITKRTEKVITISKGSDSDIDVHSWSMDVREQHGASQKVVTVPPSSHSMPLSIVSRTTEIRGSVFKLPATQLPEIYLSPKISPRPTVLSKHAGNVPVLVLDDTDSESTPRPQNHLKAIQVEQNSVPPALKGPEARQSCRTKTKTSTLTDLTNPSLENAQRTPRRTKRAAVASPSPAMSQRTIDSYWSPARPKPLVLSQCGPPAGRKSPICRTRRSASLTVATKDIQVIDLLSPSPVRTTETGGSSRRLENRYNDVTADVLVEVQPNITRGISEDDARSFEDANWTMPPGVTPRRRQKRVRRSLEGPGRAKLRRAETAPITGYDLDFDDMSQVEDFGNAADHSTGSFLETAVNHSSDADLDLQLSLDMDLARTPRVLFSMKSDRESAQPRYDQRYRPALISDDEDELPDLDTTLRRERKKASTESSRNGTSWPIARPPSTETSLPEVSEPISSTHVGTTTRRSTPDPTSGGDSTGSFIGNNRAATRKVPSPTNSPTFAPPKSKRSGSRSDIVLPTTAAVTTESSTSEATVGQSTHVAKDHPRRKKLLLPRQSLPGFFKEVDVDSVDLSGDGSGWKVSGGRAEIIEIGPSGTCARRDKGNGKTRRAFRQSAVEVLDLTGA